MIKSISRCASVFFPPQPKNIGATSCFLAALPSTAVTITAINFSATPIVVVAATSLTFLICTVALYRLFVAQNKAMTRDDPQPNLFGLRRDFIRRESPPPVANDEQEVKRVHSNLVVNDPPKSDENSINRDANDPNVSLHEFMGRYRPEMCSVEVRQALQNKLTRKDIQDLDLWGYLPDGYKKVFINKQIEACVKGEITYKELRSCFHINEWLKIVQANPISLAVRFFEDPTLNYHYSLDLRQMRVEEALQIWLAKGNKIKNLPKNLLEDMAFLQQIGRDLNVEIASVASFEELEKEYAFICKNDLYAVLPNLRKLAISYIEQNREAIHKELNAKLLEWRALKSIVEEFKAKWLEATNTPALRQEVGLQQKIIDFIRQTINQCCDECRQKVVVTENQIREFEQQLPTKYAEIIKQLEDKEKELHALQELQRDKDAKLAKCQQQIQSKEEEIKQREEQVQASAAVNKAFDDKVAKAQKESSLNRELKRLDTEEASLKNRQGVLKAKDVKALTDQDRAEYEGNKRRLSEISDRKKAILNDLREIRSSQSMQSHFSNAVDQERRKLEMSRLQDELLKLKNELQTLSKLDKGIPELQQTIGNLVQQRDKLKELIDLQQQVVIRAKDSIDQIMNQFNRKLLQLKS